MKVHVIGSKVSHIGYGKAAVEIDKALSRLGVTTEDDTAGNVLSVMLPYHIEKKREGQSLTLFSMFETNRIPEDFVDVLINYDRIFVPCEASREAYAKHHPDVRVIPLGVDPEVWKPTKRTATRPFTFLTGGAGGGRKGLKEACDTYRRVRERLNEHGIDSRLIIKVPQGEGAALEGYAGEGVTVIADWLKRPYEVQLYADSHCYVSFSKGEGWGLMPNQALAQGLPLICTAAAGQAAFKDYAYVVPHKMASTNYGIWGPVGEWWEPDLKAMEEAMVEVATTYPLYEARAWVAAHTHPYFWDETARQIVANLDDRPDTDGEYTEFRRLLFRVVTTEDRTCDIADRVYGFKRGKEEWVPADVKRILWNAHILDPSCVEENSGLLPEMIENYVAVPAVCPTCCRPLPPLAE